jgi:hypothetical protein
MNNNFFKILVVAVVAVLTLGAIGLGVAYAQNPFPNRPFTSGGMMGGYWSQQGGSNWMSAVHNWMTSTGSMHTLLWDATANALGLTSDELSAELDSGKTLAELAEERGLDRAAFIAALENAHQAGLSQSVADGILTQEQANDMLMQMDGIYEWMLDNMGTGAGYSIMDWRGGMMNRFFDQQGSNGQFTPGGCHANYAPDASQNRP